MIARPVNPRHVVRCARKRLRNPCVTHSHGVGATNFRSRKTLIVNAVAGLLLLQLGLRGVVLFANERAGNTFDVIGALNSREFLWLLVPESWTLDLITRFTFWLLLPSAVFFLVRTLLLLKSSR